MPTSTLNMILNNIFNPDYEPLDVSESFQDMLDVFESCKHGSNTSIILIGPRGSGKSYFVKKLVDKHPKAILVYLNGHVHYDDSVAMQTIVRELDINLEQSEQDKHTFSENFEYLGGVLQDRRFRDKEVLFVLDHFELFALRPKQTLLYNLFDLLQRSNEVSISLVGMSERKDVFDLLEKRVKSRFSHQKILLLGITELDKVVELYRKKLFARGRKKKILKWNESVEDVLADCEVKEELLRQTMLQRTVGWFLAVLGDAVRCTEPDILIFSKDALLTAIKNRSSSTLWRSITGMSNTELMILILIVKLETRPEPSPFSCSKLVSFLGMVKDKVDLGVSFHGCDDQSILKVLHKFETIGLILAVSASGKVKKKENSDRTPPLLQAYRLQLNPYHLDKFLMEVESVKDGFLRKLLGSKI